jgi:hypothetical protein
LECDGLPSLCHMALSNKVSVGALNDVAVTKRRQAVALQS